MSVTSSGPIRGLAPRAWLDWARWAAFPIVVLFLGRVFWNTLQEHQPVEHWLSVRYGTAWAVALGFSLACVSSGHLVIRRLASAGMSLGATLVTSFAAGVYLFFASVFALGIAGLLRPFAFFVVPGVLFLVGLPSLVRTLVPRVRDALRTPAPLSVASKLAIAAGGVGVFLVYLPILVPGNLSYDAVWYHLPLAEHYVAAGAIRPSEGGWLAGAMPHLASILYAWVMLLPKADLFVQVESILHLEMVFFLWTLAGIGPLVELLLPGERVRGAWAGVFLFPGLFVYDSGLHGGADHVAAFFAAPVLLAFAEAWRRFDARSLSLLALFLGTGILVKYTAVSLAAGPALAIAGRGAYLALREPARRKAVLSGLSVAFGVGLAVTAPHWLKNLVFYGDPIYPLLHAHLRVHPWTADSAHVLHLYTATAWIPGTTPPVSLREVSNIAATFALAPHDWPAFHGVVPVFGVLFTVASAAALFLRRSARLVGLSALTYVGIAVWAKINMQDRYLQVLLPWMTAVTVGVLVLAFRESLVHRASLGLVVGLQLVWGADAPFLPSHAMLGQSAIKSAVELLSRGYKKDYAERYAVGGDYAKIGAALPKGAKVLVHEEHIHFGLRAQSVSDALPATVAIDYGRRGNRKGVHQLLRSMGVTHVVWHASSIQLDSLASDLLFFGYAAQRAEKVANFGTAILSKVPDGVPDEAPDPRAVVLACDGTYEAGVYPVSTLHVLPPRQYTDPVFPKPETPWAKLSSDDRARAIETTTFVVQDTSCKLSAGPLPSRFTRLSTRGKYELWAQ